MEIIEAKLQDFLPSLNMMKFYFFVVFFFFFFSSSQLWLCCLSAANITHLPGFHGELPFHLEAGYVSIDDESGAELFYYFVESERRPEDDPLVLWLTGGPGCSGFVGLAVHMGPLNFKTDNFDGNTPTLVVNPYSWTKIANMIFLDWPVGTGFSYSRAAKDYITEDIQTKKNIYNFLKKWFIDHPDFVSNPFYMGGESYGGKMATLVSYDIVEGNEVSQKPKINIKGYVIGNAVTGEKTDKNSQVPHACGLGVISEEFYKLIQTNCEGENYQTPQSAVCKAHLQVFNEFLSEINVFGILEPLCSDEPPMESLGGLHRSLEENSADFLFQSSPATNCITPDLLANYWANNQNARNALHVKEGTVGRWHRCNFNFAIYNYSRSIPSSVPYHRSLTTRGYRALVYSGDHDLQIPFVGTLEWIKSLGFSVLEAWRPWHADGQVAGYTISFANNLTFATVKGGNHLAPVKRPLQTFAMFERYVTMNEKSGAEMFYYFVESERNPSEDPLLLWLLGGPGCSGINGLTLDMGPLRFKLDDFDGQLPNLYANPFSWTKISNMIFLDWPIGTGFSYSKSIEDYTTEDVEGTTFIYKFLRIWLQNHPSFLSNPFYMGGDSYGGKLAVLTAYKIVEGNEGGQKPLINIKGYLVGNAVTGEKVDTSTQAPHAYGLGIISRELYKLIMANCAGEDFKKPTNVLCAIHLETFNGFLSEINSYSVLDPDCSDEPPSTNAVRSLKENPEEFISSPSSSATDISCITGDLLANYWGNHHLVKEALHVKEGTIERFHRCDFNVNSYHYTRSIGSSVPYHYSLITRGFRALVYNGDHDLRIPFLGSLEWIKSLNFSILEPWRSWHAGGQVAGYTMLFSNNLTFATVKGGSHVAPGKMPLECFVMFERWISHKGL